MIKPIALLCAILFLSSCTTVPLTGRSQLDFIPGDMMLSMSYQQYGEFMKSNKLSADTQQAQMVKTVGARIQKAVETYLSEHGLADRIRKYQWEFNLVEGKEANAFCMPGGKVVIYTGILPMTQNETGLAVVMSHEIAHAIAQHGNERMSQGLLSTLGEYSLAAALQNKPAQTKQLWMAAVGAGTQYGILLPYARVQETEADRLGLIFMAMAGYDPKEAIAFWQRMASAKQGGPDIEFLSTHPSDQTRIRNIQSQIPEAMQYYKPA
jgi:predicted Zn-dependent protease